MMGKNLYSYLTTAGLCELEDDVELDLDIFVLYDGIDVNVGVLDFRRLLLPDSDRDR